MESTKEIGLEDAKVKLDNSSAVFVDIRDPGSYSEAHIAGAIHLDDESIEGFIAEADKNREHVIYCYHGNSSKGATEFLSEKGLSNVRSLIGGFEAWRVSLPTES